MINGFLRIGPVVGERTGGGLLLAYSPARVSGLPIRRSDDTGADVAMRRYRRSAPAIPGLYRARYRRARSDDPGGVALRPGVYHRSPRDPPGRHDAFPPSYTRAPAAFPAVLRDDPRPPSPAVLRDNPPGRSGRRLPRLTGRSPAASRATPGATPPSYDPRLTTPVDTFLTVLQGDPRPPSPSYSPRLTRRSPAARRLPQSYARAPRDAFPVLRGDPPAAPPSYDPVLQPSPRSPPSRPRLPSRLASVDPAAAAAGRRHAAAAEFLWNVNELIL